MVTIVYRDKSKEFDNLFISIPLGIMVGCLCDFIIELFIKKGKRYEEIKLYTFITLIVMNLLDDSLFRYISSGLSFLILE